MNRGMMFFVVFEVIMIATIFLLVSFISHDIHLMCIHEGAC